MKRIKELEKLIEGRSGAAAIRAVAEAFPQKVVFSTSLGYEDQVITHFIFSENIPVGIFTLDTGRLFPETSELIERTNAFYGKEIKVYRPQQNAVDELVAKKGAKSFYESVENRKECCFIRKVEPLKRALAGNEIWITGIRSGQSDGRGETPQLEWDEANQVIKYHPLLNWSFETVKKFISDNKVPYNPLHDKGYVSIGCEPCTRAVKPGEDLRAGRWWWEQSSAKECGLHSKKLMESESK